MLASRNTFKISFNRIAMGFAVFLASYMTTITVNAQTATGQPAHAIHLNEESGAEIVGTVVSAEDGFIIINSGGKDMRIDLSKIKMRGAADAIFQPGMNVIVNGELEGNDFGTPVVEASSITAAVPTQPAQ